MSCDDSETNRTVKLTIFESDCGREPVKPHSERKSMLSFLRFPMFFGIGPCMFGFDDSVLCVSIPHESLWFCVSGICFEKINKQLQKVCEIHIGWWDCSCEKVLVKVQYAEHG